MKDQHPELYTVVATKAAIYGVQNGEKVLYRFRDAVKAEHRRQRLEAEGYEARVLPPLGVTA